METPPSSSDMMTRQELARRVRAFYKGANTLEWWTTAILIPSMIGILVLLIKAKTADAPYKEAMIAGIWGLVSVAAGVGVVSVILRKRRLKALGLFCPSCGTTLEGGTGSLAVVTRYCCQCGSQIVAECEEACATSDKTNPPSAHGHDLARPAPLLTRAELTQRKEAFYKIVLKTGWPMLAALLVASAGCWALLWSPAVRDGRIALLGLALMLAKGCILIVLRGRQGKRWRKSFGLECPSCQAFLDGSTGNLALKTLYCCECGTQILAEEEDKTPGPDTDGPEAPHAARP